MSSKNAFLNVFLCVCVFAITNIIQLHYILPFSNFDMESLGSFSLFVNPDDFESLGSFTIDLMQKKYTSYYHVCF